MILAAKIATLMGWLFIIANWIMPFGGQLESMLHYSGIGLAIAHAIETAIFFPKAKKAGGNLALHALQLFIFGYPHNMALDQAINAAASE